MKYLSLILLLFIPISSYADITLSPATTTSPYVTGDITVTGANNNGNLYVIVNPSATWTNAWDDNCGYMTGAELNSASGALNFGVHGTCSSYTTEIGTWYVQCFDGGACSTLRAFGLEEEEEEEGGGSGTSTTATSTDALLGSIGFGLAVIITILFIAVIGFVYNKITIKKPWQ